MKKLLLLVGLLITGRGYSQCPFAVTLTSSGNCPGSLLTVVTPDSLSQIVWLNGTTVVSTVNAATIPATSGVTVAGGFGAGPAPDQVSGPYAICMDGAGNLYVVDADNDRVQRWAPGSTVGVTVAGGHGRGNAANQLANPCDVVIDGSGNLYIADNFNNRVQKWAPGATSGVTVAGGHGLGPANNQLNYPAGLFIDKSGNLYVSDGSYFRVQKWAPGAASGVTVAGGGYGSTGNGLLSAPAGLCVDGSGNIYIADVYSSCVVKWTPGATSGVTIVGGPGSAANQVNEPNDVCLDAQGNLYIADFVNNRIQEWAPGATSGITVAGGNGPGLAANQLHFPFGVYVDNQGNIYVADHNNSRVQKWAPASQGFSRTYYATLPGTYTAAVTDTAGCTVTTNAVTLLPAAAADITITAPTTEICEGSPLTFTATPGSGTPSPVYQWLVNGIPAGNGGLTYTDSGLTNGDQVSCVLTSTATCILGTSSPLPVTVNPLPHVDSSKVIPYQRGQSLVLDAGVTGTISSYSWSPSSGLSDPTVEHPLVTPSGNITYTLDVVGAGGCKASGSITLKQEIPIKVPNAFTPNGDGHNDVLYIPGDPATGRINDFSIFSRWGQKIFQVHDVPTGDPAFGWDGTYKGTMAPSGTYAYTLIIQLSDGSRKAFQGTVLLIR